MSDLEELVIPLVSDSKLKKEESEEGFIYIQSQVLT